MKIKNTNRLFPKRVVLNKIILAGCFLITGLLISCSDDDSSEKETTAATIEIKGEYTDDFGGTHTITATLWEQGYSTGSSKFKIVKIDNENNLALALNDSANGYNPDKYSRFNWATSSDGSLYYCQSVFDSETADAAEATTAPDASNPTSTGCGGFA